MALLSYTTSSSYDAAQIATDKRELHCGEMSPGPLSLYVMLAGASHWLEVQQLQILLLSVATTTTQQYLQLETALENALRPWEWPHNHWTVVYMGW